MKQQRMQGWNYIILFFAAISILTIISIIENNDTVKIAFKEYNYLKVQQEFKDLSLQIITLNEEKGSAVKPAVREKFNEVLKEVMEDSEVSLNTTLTFEELHHLVTTIGKGRFTDDLALSTSGEYIQTPYQLIQNNLQGDCEDYSLLLYSIAKAKGLDVQIVIGRNVGEGHAWIQIIKQNIFGEEKVYEYDSTSSRVCLTGCISNQFDNVTYVGEEE